MDEDLVRQFLIQIRQAFMCAKPKPVFMVVRDRLGNLRVAGTKRLEFYEFPEITDPVVPASTLLTKSFQKRLNCALQRFPAVVMGYSDVGIGKMVVAREHKWKVEILRIRDMVMDDNGAIRIQAYDCRGDRT